ncbi:MAG: D-alanyl-D-alanine dipeptidase, partial [Acidimicrobiia bacterium]|nr:D-alanyl-D-alanine dipeptidase [Acidimicrobiia bacterium]
DCSWTLAGIPLALGSGFDDFSDRSRADALENDPGIDRELRRRLFWTMHDAGFVLIDCEWWHFEYGTNRWAGITGVAPVFGPASLPGT